VDRPQRSGNSRIGIVEHGDHSVSGVFEHPATSRLDRTVHQAVMDLQRRPHRIAVDLPQRSRPNDIGHHKHRSTHAMIYQPTGPFTTGRIWPYVMSRTNTQERSDQH